MRYLVDTNVLIRRTDADSADRAVCSEAVDGLLETGHELCVCAQVLIEFWAASTRPRDVNGLGLAVTVASQQVSDFRETFTRLPEPPDMAERWQEVAERHSVAGKQAHDARIAALMLAHNVTHLLTLNTADFARYAEITTITPQQVLDQPATQ
jgi:predicted nucleic acid-binding protein